MSLSSDSLLSDQSLNLGALIEGLVSLLDFSPDDVLSHIINLACFFGVSESEHFSDIVSSLGAESSWSLVVSKSLDLLVSLLGDSELDDSQIGTTDASSDGLSLSLSSSSGNVSGGPCN